MNIPFHQYQRYKMVKIIIDSIRIEENTFSILEVGANEHKNLQMFLPEDKILYMDIKLPDHLKEDPSYVEGDATNMSFPNSSFDFVIALDVLEHIPENLRDSFCKEMERVSKYGFIISAPFENNGVENAEERIREYFKAIYNESVLWSEEHLENGLPSLTKTLKNIERQSENYHLIINHGDINLFEKLIKMEYITGVDQRLIPYWLTINKYYNEELFYKDFTERSVRIFIVVLKNRKQIIRLEEDISKIKKELTVEDINQIDNLERSINQLLNIIKSKDLVETNLIDNLLKIDLDLGFGFNEEQSFIIKLNGNLKIQQSIDLSLYKSIHKIRVHLINSSKILKIENIFIVENIEKIYLCNEFVTNGTELSDSLYAFTNNDPQMLLTMGNIESIDKIILILEFMDYNIDASSFVEKAVRSIDEINEQKVQIGKSQKEFEISQKEFEKSQKEFEESQKEFEKSQKETEWKIQNLLDAIDVNATEKQLLIEHLNNVEHTISWKITKPLRILKRMLRRDDIF